MQVFQNLLWTRIAPTPYSNHSPLPQCKYVLILSLFPNDYWVRKFIKQGLTGTKLLRRWKEEQKNVIQCNLQVCYFPSTASRSSNLRYGRSKKVICCNIAIYFYCFDLLLLPRAQYSRQHKYPLIHFWPGCRQGPVPVSENNPSQSQPKDHNLSKVRNGAIKRLND